VAAQESRRGRRRAPPSWCFGLVRGLIAWIYLLALVTVLAAEINVVAERRLWPRALLTPFTDRVRLTPADERAYTGYADSERHKGFEVVDVGFEQPQSAERQLPSLSDMKTCPEGVEEVTVAARVFHGLRRREFDPRGLFIRGLEQLGLAWDVMRVSPDRHEEGHRSRGVTRAQSDRTGSLRPPSNARLASSAMGPAGALIGGGGAGRR
jgi:hypothetical protein